MDWRQACPARPVTVRRGCGHGSTPPAVAAARRGGLRGAPASWREGEREREREGRLQAMRISGRGCEGDLPGCMLGGGLRGD
jgi:hypothetical protein